MRGASIAGTGRAKRACARSSKRATWIGFGSTSKVAFGKMGLSFAAQRSDSVSTCAVPPNHQRARRDTHPGEFVRKASKPPPCTCASTGTPRARQIAPTVSLRRNEPPEATLTWTRSGRRS